VLRACYTHSRRICSTPAERSGRREKGNLLKATRHQRQGKEAGPTLRADITSRPGGEDRPRAIFEVYEENQRSAPTREIGTKVARPKATRKIVSLARGSSRYFSFLLVSRSGRSLLLGIARLIGESRSADANARQGCLFGFGSKKIISEREREERERTREIRVTGHNGVMSYEIVKVFC